MGTLLLTGFRRQLSTPEETLMTWTTPAATDLRFGFEITMYIANR